MYLSVIFTRTFSSPAVAAADSSAATFAPASTTPDKILNKAPHHDIPRARAVRKRFKTSVKKLNLVCGRGGEEEKEP